MPNAQFRVAALSLLFLLSFGGNLPGGLASQDSLGGASLIFIAQSYALLGYSFFQQKKYAEATEALKKALELAPNTEEYKKLLEESVSRQQHQ